jgi:predicted deacylase
VIGYSSTGLPLEVFQFGSGEHVYMIVAGIHGGYEWNTVALADQLITLLPGRIDLVPEDVTLFVLRAFNPDGLARSRELDGRANGNSADLNRNWPVLWQAEWPKEGCRHFPGDTAGAYPASEPETKALMVFLLTRRVEALISYHSAALGIFPGGQPPDEASKALAQALDDVSPYPYPPYDTGCQYTGQLIDWASAQGIAAVDVELSTHEDIELGVNLEILQAFLEWRP